MESSGFESAATLTERLQRVSQFLCEDVDYDNINYVESLREACNELIFCRVQEPNSKDAKQLEATHSLLSAMLQDKLLELDEATVSSHVHLSSLYSISIVKFCNILQSCWIDDYGNLRKDIQMQKGTSTLKSVAVAVGIPEWFVDCRNKICHSMPPSLILLRQAAFVALQWLKTNYWQDSYHTNIRTEDNPTATDISEALNRLGKSEEKPRKAAANVIKKWLNNEMNKKLLIVEAAKYLVTNLCQFSGFHEMNEEDMCIPEEVQVTCEPILTLLRDDELLLALLHELVKSCNEEEQATKASIVWFTVIVSTITNPKHPSSLKIMLKPKNSRVKSGKQKVMWIKLLHTVMRSPNKYTPVLIDSVQKALGNVMNESTANMLRKLSFIYTDDTINTEADKISVKTMHDFAILGEDDKDINMLNESSD